MNDYITIPLVLLVPLVLVLLTLFHLKHILLVGLANHEVQYLHPEGHSRQILPFLPFCPIKKGLFQALIYFYRFRR